MHAQIVTMDRRLRRRRNASQAAACEAAKRWGLSPAPLPELIAHSANSVYLVTRAGHPAILRLTDPDFRAADETEAELETIEQFVEQGISACRPLRSAQGRWIEGTNTGFYSCLFEHAPGHDVQDLGGRDGETILRAWGHALGALHLAARRLRPVKRWHWDDEDLIRDADDYLQGEAGLQHRWFDLRDELRSYSVNGVNYGMTHSDFGPGNFFWDDRSEVVTAFDFGNCCYHWYAWDVAVGLRWLRERPEPEVNQAWLLEGYRSVNADVPWTFEHMEALIELRYFYILLDRLWEARVNPSSRTRHEAQAARLGLLSYLGWGGQ